MLLFNFTVHLLANLLRPASFYSDRPFSFFSKNCEIVVIHRWLSFLSSPFIMFDKCFEEEEDKAIEIVKSCGWQHRMRPRWIFGKK